MSNRLLKRRQFVSVRVVLIFPSFSKASLRPLEKSSSRAVSEISAVESRGNRSTCEVFNPTVSLLLTLIFFFTTDSRCSSPRTRECPEGTRTIS